MSDIETYSPRLMYAGKNPRDKDNGEYYPAYVIEIPPHYTNMVFCDNHYRIPLPWMYYTITTSKTAYYRGRSDNGLYGRVCSAFGRPERIRGASDPLFYMPLPNLYASMTFCNNTCHVPAAQSEDITTACLTTINMFWDSEFSYVREESNPDIWKTINKLANSRYAGDVYAWWENLSMEEILKFPFGQTKVTSMDTWPSHPAFGYQSYCGKLR